jgi:hypothetical protein
MISQWLPVGGLAFQQLTTPAENATVNRNGQFLLYHDRKGGENPWGKQHASAGTRGDSDAKSRRQPDQSAESAGRLLGPAV